MKQTHRLLFFIILFAITGASTPYILGPYLRSLTFDTPASFSAIPITYDCFDGHCIGFNILNSHADKFLEYEGKHLYPYSSTVDKDLLDNNMAHLLANKTQTVCIKGLVHQYPVNTLRLFQAGHGGYKFLVTDITEQGCLPKSE